MERFLPLYEAKMINLYDPRWATYELDGEGGYRSRLISEAEKRDPAFVPLPRYWVPKHAVDAALEGWPHPWLLGWRDITNATNERTLIAAMFPRAGVGNNLPISMVDHRGASEIAWLIAQASSYVVDYAARFKVGGTHLNFFITQQLPFLGPELTRSVRVGEESLGEWVANRVAKLTGPIHADDRARTRAELDAMMFRLFGVAKEDAEYVLETFPIVMRRELRQYGERRTVRLVRDAYDRIGEARFDPPIASVS